MLFINKTGNHLYYDHHRSEASMADKIKRLLELEGQLKYHDYLYFELDKPQISDEQYEDLSSEYRSLREACPEYQTTYGQGFVAPNPSMELVPIVEPMLSVSKRKDKGKYLEWVKDKADAKAIHEDKLDGMALRLIYVDGDLARVHTRGDGTNGADLSHRRHLLRHVPDHIPSDVSKGRTEYTGEAFCTFADFDAYVKMNQLDPKQTDTRSTVSGLMKRFQASEKDNDLPIYFKVYGASKNIRDELETYDQLRGYMALAGFDLPRVLTEDEVEEMLNLPSKPTLSYPIDGIVAKSNDLRDWDTPQKGEYWTYAVCYKFPTSSIETTVTGIDWTLSLEGQLVGTLLYEPVNYDGTTLTRAKLDYAQSYFDKGLAIGSVIRVTKANEIIPRLVSMVTAGTGERLKYPDQCPFCGEMVTLDQEAGTAYCNNDACEGQLLRQLIRLVDRKDGLDIKGLGERGVQALLDNGFLSNHADIFKLTVNDMVNANISQGVAESIIGQIQDLNRFDLHRWLCALGIPGLGLVRSIDIANYSAKKGQSEDLRFHSLEDLMQLMTDAKFLSDLFGLDGLAIGNYVRQNEENITEFLSHYDFNRARTPSLEGIPIAISGGWVAMPRQMLSEKLAEAGFVLSDKVTRSCKVLLLGDKPSASKVEKAKGYNIPIVDIRSLHDIKNVVAVLSK
jgi:DNA ligase (NAD+)